MRKNVATILATGAVLAMGAESAGMPSLTPEPRRDSSKPATMTRKAWKKRKTRLRITKKSRQINRA